MNKQQKPFNISVAAMNFKFLPSPKLSPLLLSKVIFW